MALEGTAAERARYRAVEAVKEKIGKALEKNGYVIRQDICSDNEMAVESVRHLKLELRMYSRALDGTATRPQDGGESGIGEITFNRGLRHGRWTIHELYGPLTRRTVLYNYSHRTEFADFIVSAAEILRKAQSQMHMTRCYNEAFGNVMHNDPFLLGMTMSRYNFANLKHGAGLELQRELNSKRFAIVPRALEHAVMEKLSRFPGAVEVVRIRSRHRSELFVATKGALEPRAILFWPEARKELPALVADELAGSSEPSATRNNITNILRREMANVRRTAARS